MKRLLRRLGFLSLEERMAWMDACIERQRQAHPDAPIEIISSLAWAERDAHFVPFWKFWA